MKEVDGGAEFEAHLSHGRQHTETMHGDTAFFCSFERGAFRIGCWFYDTPSTLACYGVTMEFDMLR